MATKTCSICKVRPQMTAAERRAEGASRDMDYCVYCHTEALWENTHNDSGHGDPNGEANFTEESVCWICNPELNPANANYRLRTGTSRLGMIINVPLRADGKTKAGVVADKLAPRFATKVSTRKGITTLTLDFAGDVSFKLRWDADGHYLYAASTATVNGKVRKVRNVAEALRIAAAA